MFQSQTSRENASGKNTLASQSPCSAKVLGQSFSFAEFMFVEVEWGTGYGFLTRCLAASPQPGWSCRGAALT